MIPVTTWMNLKNIKLKKKKPVTKAHILYDSTYMKSTEQVNPSRLVDARDQGKRGVPANGYGASLFRVTEIFQNQIVVVVAQFREYTKNPQTVYFKRVNFMVWKLHLNKAIFCFKTRIITNLHH